jgi:hypothetical protein
MTNRAWYRKSALLIAALLLSACSGSAATSAPPVIPSPQPTAVSTAAPAATAAPVATELPATAAPVATPEPEPAPTVQPLVNSAGQVVLQLSAGAGDAQVGITKEDPNIIGPRSFRIGADGSIRVLDNVNKRVRFFDQSGKIMRTLAIAAAQDPLDFIVNTAGEVFVFDRAGSQVLRYGPNGDVTATIPLSAGVAANADGIMLNSAQDLMLVQNNQSFWVLVHQGVTVPPEIQPLTMRAGTVTPRSPTFFQTTYLEALSPYLHIAGIRGAPPSELIAEVDGRQIHLPDFVQFFNIDRAMNLYFTRTSPEADAFDVWRVNPDGTPAGGVHIPTGACGVSWRSLYVDQTGVAWTMCVNESGATINRHPLLGFDGTPLSEPAQEAADVSWKPGARLDAA